MSTALATATQAAHSLATSILGRAQIQTGASIPSSADLKENTADEPKQLDLTGKNLIVRRVSSLYESHFIS
jgi:2-Cys peroxiredoxin 5